MITVQSLDYISEIQQCISEGRPHATLIDWAESADLFGRTSGDPVEPITRAMRELMDRGWVYDDVSNRLNRDGWYIWFRSQGTLARPIAQWAKIA